MGCTTCGADLGWCRERRADQCGCTSIRRNARATTGATHWRPCSSTSTTWATRPSATTASSRRGSRTRPAKPWPTAPSTRSRSRSEAMTIQRARVDDWATDFDHTDPEWVADPYPIWQDLRARCPVAHSDRYGGTWLPVRHEDVSAVAYDTEHFTSRSVVVSEVRPGPDDLPAPIGVAPPITSDPPFHALARRLLLPAFSPKRIKAFEPFTRELCGELLDAV